MPFAKIMKKYDKAAKLRLGPVYLKEIERSYFAISNKVSITCSCTDYPSL